MMRNLLRSVPRIRCALQQVSHVCRTNDCSFSLAIHYDIRSYNCDSCLCSRRTFNDFELATYNMCFSLCLCTQRRSDYPCNDVIARIDVSVCIREGREKCLCLKSRQCEHFPKYHILYTIFLIIIINIFVYFIISIKIFKRNLIKISISYIFKKEFFIF